MLSDLQRSTDSRRINDFICWAMLCYPRQANADATIAAALAAGITDFDTAPWYGSGASEERLGRALRTVDQGQVAKVITKAGRLFREADGSSAGAGFDAPDRPSIQTRVCSNDYTAAGCRTSLAESLIRLGMPRIHTLRIHDPNDNSLNRRGMDSFVDEVAIANGPDGMIGEMINMRSQGLVDSIGLGMNCNQEGYMGAPDEVLTNFPPFHHPSFPSSVYLLLLKQSYLYLL
jgi:aryl-alcohol dehydrogenase-like predicted oxidoreductase